MGVFLIGLISVLTTAVLVFGFTFMYSIVSIKSTIALWGYDQSDISMRIDDENKIPAEKFKDGVLMDSRVKNYSVFGDINGIIPVNNTNKDEEGESSLNIVINS
ncbi:MAG: hypothetical protein ABF289_19300 [Clostridiales bacterium]